jgi:hypothetical protein
MAEGASQTPVFVALAVVVFVGWCVATRRINGVMRATGMDRKVFGSEIVDTHEGIAGKCMSMLYGKLPASQVPQVGMLSGILFCIIGVYWLLRSLKVRSPRCASRPPLAPSRPLAAGASSRTRSDLDPLSHTGRGLRALAPRAAQDTVFASTVGIEYQPRAKMVSLCVVFVLLFVYNKLIDTYEKHVLFYILSVAYGTVFLLIALVLQMPGIGLDNNTPPDPSRLIGW